MLQELSLKEIHPLAGNACPATVLAFGVLAFCKSFTVSESLPVSYMGMGCDLDSQHAAGLQAWRCLDGCGSFLALKTRCFLV